MIFEQLKVHCPFSQEKPLSQKQRTPPSVEAVAIAIEFSIFWQS
jgi:hypothetical protein